MAKVTLRRATIAQLTALLNGNSPAGRLHFAAAEDIAPQFLLQLAIDQLQEDPDNADWLAPRLIVVNQLIVGLCSFKGVPNPDGIIEIGYGITPLQRGLGFATQAVARLVQEGFSAPEVRTIMAHTVPQNYASQRVLSKNGFRQGGSTIDPNEGPLLIWRIANNQHHSYALGFR